MPLSFNVSIGFFLFSVVFWFIQVLKFSLVKKKRKKISSFVTQFGAKVPGPGPTPSARWPPAPEPWGGYRVTKKTWRANLLSRWLNFSIKILMCQPPASFMNIFVLFNDNFTEILWTSAAFELGSSEMKAISLTSWPTQQPINQFFVFKSQLRDCDLLWSL